MKPKSLWFFVALGLVLALGITAVGLQVDHEDASAAALQINGAGASFPYPIYSKWFDQYHKDHPGVQINYQSIGSGGGIRQISARTVDFGASDGPMTDEDLAKVDRKLLHIPTVIGAVSVVYNIPGVKASGLKLTGDVLADIFMGKIMMWNDPRIAKLNPDVKLPRAAIAVTHRSDGSGTTYIFSDYMSSVSPAWAKKVGKGKALRWPAGMGGKGNEGVAGLIRQLPGAIGYVEQAYADQNHLNQAALKNKAGNFVTPSLHGASLAAAGVDMPADYRVSIVNAAGDETYPIASFTWMLVYQNAYDKEKGQVLADFLWWAIHDGQKLAADLNYAPLPDSVVKKLEGTLKTLNYNGESFLK